MGILESIGGPDPWSLGKCLGQVPSQFRDSGCFIVPHALAETPAWTNQQIGILESRGGPDPWKLPAMNS